MNKNILALIFLIFSIFVISFLFLLGLDKVDNDNKILEPLFSEARVVFGSEVLFVQVAENQSARTLGLSYRESLDPYDGLLFIFEEYNRHGIWMKDMNFPIDILWLDYDMQVVWLEKDVLPESYPDIFHSPTPAWFVLEIPVGMSLEMGFEVGSKLELVR